MRYLIDTSICIAILRKQPLVLKRLSAASPNDCAISSITLYELLTGVEKCRDPIAERAKVAALQNALTTLEFDPGAAAQSASARAVLEALGVSIGPYDLLIAGQALAAGLVVVTGNVAEFNRIAGLKVEDWTHP
jgi:tRNA(fMet)-specific endonuclease VapC